MSTTTRPTDSRSTLTLADLERVFDEVQHPPWWPMIRDALVVEVRPTVYATRGVAHALDCDAASAYLLPMAPREGRVMVLCHPDDEPLVSEMVMGIREPW